MDESAKYATWKTWLMMAATGAVTSAGGYITSHWGGTTSEHLKDTENRLGSKIDDVNRKVATEGDNLKKYVDDAIAAAEERITPKVAAKKRKVPRE